MRVLITGGSHVGALRRAQKAGAAPPPAGMSLHIRPLGSGITVARSFFALRDGRIEITNERFRENLPGIPLAGLDCDRVGFCTALYSRPIWLGRDWARFAPPGVDDGRTVISHALLRRLVLDDLRYVLAFLDALRSLGLRPFVVDGPRPFRHNPEVERAGERAVQIIDRTYRRIAARSLDELGVPVVAGPPDTYDEAGFTRPEFRRPSATDRTHANEAYGARMLGRIHAFLTGEATAPLAEAAATPGG